MMEAAEAKCVNKEKGEYCCAAVLLEFELEAVLLFQACWRLQEIAK